VRDISPAERRELLKSQTGKLKETLAAMSLIEAEEALEEGDIATAINAFRDAIKNFPENPFYYIKLSEVFLAESDIPEAIKTLNLALTHSPTNPVIKAKIAELEIANKNANKDKTPSNAPSLANASSASVAIQPPPQGSVKSKYAKLGLPGISPSSAPSSTSLGQDKTVPLPAKVLTKTQLERRERKKELKSQTGRLKETLAEMSLIEAEESLERGDRLTAIIALQDAIRNYPENPAYYLKLAEMHVQDTKIHEAIKLLTTALEYAPQNPELTSKLNQLQESIKPKNEIIAPPQAPNPQALKEIDPAVLADIDAHAGDRSKTPDQKQTSTKFNASKLLCPKCNLINDIQDSKCTSCNTPLNRFNRLKLKSQETILELSNRLKTRDIVVLVAIVIIIIVSVPLARRENAILVEPLEPIDQGVLNPQKAEFQWDSITENIGFLLVIEKDGKKIIERYTNKLVYTLTYEEMQLLEIGSIYKWEAIPVSPKRVTLNYRTKKHEFRLGSNQPSTNQESPPTYNQQNNQPKPIGKGLDK